MSDVLQSGFQGKMLVFYNARSWESAQSRPAIAPTLIRNKKPDKRQKYLSSQRHAYSGAFELERKNLGLSLLI